MENRFETFTVLINRISRSIRRIKTQAMEEYGLRSVHVSCLYHLYFSEGITATELRDRCAEDKATISRAVEYLERSGYVTSPSQRDHHYKRPLYLTNRGREVGAYINGRVDAILRELDLALTETERDEFYRSLIRISEGLEALAGKDRKT